MRKCPVCAELIQEDAIKCRYCGEILSKPKVKIENDKSKETAIIIIILILIFIIGLYIYIKSNNDNIENLKKQQEINNQNIALAQKETEQKYKDANAMQGLYDSINLYYKCLGNDSHNYSFISNCLSNTLLPTVHYSGTSCDTKLNNVIDNIVLAREHCGKAGFYEDGKGYIKSSISIETYTDEVSQCKKATDQFLNYPYQCGSAMLDFKITSTP